MARTIAPTMLLLAFVLCTSTFYKARAQAPATAPSLGPSSSSPPSSPLPPPPSSLPPSPTYGPTASAPGADCTTLLFGMADCLSYVQEGSNETKPDKACCPELKTLVDTAPQCLCALLASNNSSAYGIDYDRATKLPSVCKVDTPPVSNCALLGIPVGGPSGSAVPASSPRLSPGRLPSEGASTGPTSEGNNGHKASTAAATVVAVLVGFAITSFPTFF
ncbi:Non-specific lipid-transfer protein-like protein [Morus notabilis]|uniref:Non-specific lipid-transfer protein-like protein n=1 Tax=Morus notabilis TaxID=981085 RepID=W9R576_9ROSA|nr:non-specific lipid-transfer protein-like protein At2g13820 [Morus notabilis]EXB54688.1 Non-specific lipid-transfer protein-like protein [Morus notabilis]